jgi:hypothetical protein
MAIVGIISFKTFEAQGVIFEDQMQVKHHRCVN